MNIKPWTLWMLQYLIYYSFMPQQKHADEELIIIGTRLKSACLTNVSNQRALIIVFIRLYFAQIRLFSEI